jgi:CRISPR-associated endonuclease Csn1
LISKYGKPEAIHIELARDLARSAKERKKIETENRKWESYKNELRGHAAELLGREPTGNEFIKYRLWKEQNGLCAYSGEYIQPAVLADPTATEIDHILPFSRSWDNSLGNKVICLTRENREKGNLTPFEKWGQSNRWPRLEAQAQSLPYAKRRRILMRDFDDETAGEWKERNLNDTRYISRTLMNYLEECLGDTDTTSKFVHARSGSHTAMLRGLWGLAKSRQDSVTHHALDAIVLACTTQGMVQKVAGWNRYQRSKKGDPGYYAPKPWEGFRQDALEAVSGVFVSRQPSRKASGRAHRDTIMSLRKDKDGNEIAVKKVMLSKWASQKKFNVDILEDLVDVEMVDGEPKGRNAWLYRLLKNRLEEYNYDHKKAFSQPLYMPLKKGKDESQAPVIRSVKIRDNTKSYIHIPGRDGVAELVDMVRVDVFRKKGKYFLIPIYAHQVAKGMLPDRICKARLPEEQWQELDADYEFLFSLYKNDYVMAEKQNGEVKQGYFIKMDRASAAITLRPHDAPDDGSDLRSIGVQKLKKLRKFSISLLGDMSEIKREKRRGLAKRPIAASGKGVAAPPPTEAGE